jgi:hypothetical protein
MSPIYKIVNQDDTPLYQISKPNPNAEFWTMFYFKYAGHQIPPKRIEVGVSAPVERGKSDLSHEEIAGVCLYGRGPGSTQLTNDS